MLSISIVPPKMSRIVFLFLVSFAIADRTQLRVEEGGIYSRVTVSIQEQNQPKDCAKFIGNLEVSKV